MFEELDAIVNGPTAPAISPGIHTEMERALALNPGKKGTDSAWTELQDKEKVDKLESDDTKIHGESLSSARQLIEIRKKQRELRKERSFDDDGMDLAKPSGTGSALLTQIAGSSISAPDKKQSYTTKRQSNKAKVSKVTSKRKLKRLAGENYADRLQHKMSKTQGRKKRWIVS
jgi:hypothetical protein